MHKTIIFLLKNPLDITLFASISHLTLQESYEVIDENTLKTPEGMIYFDYLITDNVDNVRCLNLAQENKMLLTNFFLQTSTENIYALSPATNCSLAISEQLLRIYEDLTTK
ncbi:MAG TPA: hypothetical protein VJZ51_05965 [Bacilli bacterium]|nr:hypothetical protein [Bacilli bacterium]